jgi:hypothetical protein
MRRGEFDVPIPNGTDDEVGQLGQALQDLGATLDARFREVEALVTVTNRINAGLILDEVLDHVFGSFRPVIPYNRIGFSLLEDEGKTVRARWARSDAPHMKITRGYSAPLAGSSLERIITTGEPRILNDLEAYLREHPDSESTRLIVDEGMRSSLTCPLVAIGKPVGFMFFTSMNPDAYRDAHIGIFLQIAGQLAVIVEKGRLYQQLLELNDLKNKFLGIAAHDLRNPITVFKGYLGILLAGILGEVPAEQLDVMKKMDRASDTMLSLINDLLDVASIESGSLELHIENTDIPTYLRDLQESNELLAKAKDIELKLELTEPLPAVDLDQDRVGQVVNNLVTNAIKFSYPATTIRMLARAEGQELHIAVIDEGQGIPNGELPKLFNEFGKTSVRPTAGEKSTGLGLAIVRRMVEAHGGRIWVESTVGKGSTFTFALPLEQPSDES